MGTGRFLVLGIALCASLQLGACLPDGQDPNKAAEQGKASAAYYASTLGNVAIRVQDLIVSDSKWFTASNSSEINFAAHGIRVPDDLGAKLRAMACLDSRTGHGQQVTWIDGKDDSGRFTIKSLGNGAGKIASELRKQIGANQIGSNIGGGTISLASGGYAYVLPGCQAQNIPIGAPVLVFDIQHPAAPKQDVARTEYRTQSCGQDASGRMMRGIMVQSRTIVFKPNGTISPDDPSAGWRTEDMGACIGDVDVAITNREALAGGAAATLNDFAAVSLKDQLHAALANMDCMTVTVQSQSTNRSGQNETRLKTIDTCANTNVTGIAALSDNKRGDNEDTREIACTGVSDDMAAKLGDIPLTGAKIAWTPKEGFTNLITLTRKVATHGLSNHAQDQSNKSLWTASAIDCAATETASLACNQVPGAPGTIPAPPMSNNPRTTKDFTIPSSEKPYPMNDAWQARVIDKNYFTRARAIESGGLSLTRSVSAKSWEDAATFKPRITGDPWTISQNQCTWDRLDMLPDCPIEFDSAKQGDWWPTGIVLDLGWLSADNNALASAYWYDERAPDPAELSEEAFSSLMVKPWTADVPISDAQAKASASAWVFRYLRDKGEMPLAVAGYPDSTSPNYQGDYLRSWKTVAPNNIAFKDGTSVWNGKQYAYGFTLTKQPQSTDIQTTLLNQHGVITRYKAAVNGNTVGIGATEYVNPLYCGRSEEREFTVPFKHFACGGALIEEKAATIKYTSYRRWRGTAPGVGSWSKAVGRFSTADDQLRAAQPSLFDRPIPADSMYLTASGDPIFPKGGLSYTDECAPNNDFCPALTTPTCGPNEIVVNIPIFKPGGLQLGNCTQNVCGALEPNAPNPPTQPPVQCPAVTQPTCTGFTHLVAGPKDANGCDTPGTCERNACPSLANVPQNQADCDRQEWNMGPALWYVDQGQDANGCMRGGYCHQETWEECLSRAERGENATYQGCCDVYSPGGCSSPDPGGYTGYN